MDLPENSTSLPGFPPTVTPRTLSIDDFIQISHAARADIGEEVISDLSSFMDRAGYTQTTGSFRITQGGVEMASVPRKSITGQVNVYVGSMGDEMISKNLLTRGSDVLAVQMSALKAKGIEGTAGISVGKGELADIILNVHSKSRLPIFGTLSHELGHSLDRAAGEILFSGLLTNDTYEHPILKLLGTEQVQNATGYRDSRTLLGILEGVDRFKDLLDEGVSADEALKMSDLLRHYEYLAETHGASEALADTSNYSAIRRVAENNPELARRLGLDDTATEFTINFKTYKKTLKMDILSKLYDFSAIFDDGGSLSNAYTIGNFKPAIDTFGLIDFAKEGVSQDLLNKIRLRHSIISAATYAARVGGFEEGSDEFEIIDSTARGAGQTFSRMEVMRQKFYESNKKLYEETEFYKLYEETYQRQRLKGRFNIDIIDDISDTRIEPEIVSTATEVIDEAKTIDVTGKDRVTARVIDEAKTIDATGKDRVTARISSSPRRSPPAAKVPSLTKKASRSTASQMSRTQEIAGAVASGSKGSNNLRMLGIAAAVGVGATAYNKMKVRLSRSEQEERHRIQMQRRPIQ